GRRVRKDEPAQVRYLNGKRNEEMGTRREGGEDQGGVTVPSWLHMQGSATCSTSPRRGEVGSRSDPGEGELAHRKSPAPSPQPSPHWGEGARRIREAATAPIGSFHSCPAFSPARISGAA